MEPALPPIRHKMHVGRRSSEESRQTVNVRRTLRRLERPLHAVARTGACSTVAALRVRSYTAEATRGSARRLNTVHHVWNKLQWWHARQQLHGRMHGASSIHIAAGITVAKGTRNKRAVRRMAVGKRGGRGQIILRRCINGCRSTK